MIFGAEKPGSRTIAIGTVVAVLTVMGGLYQWDQGLEAEVHKFITDKMQAGDVELDLQRVELELKLLRTIQERRPLTADEQDRKNYLEQLRIILRNQQKEKIG